MDISKIIVVIDAVGAAYDRGKSSLEERGYDENLNHWLGPEVMSSLNTLLRGHPVAFLVITSKWKSGEAKVFRASICCKTDLYLMQ